MISDNGSQRCCAEIELSKIMLDISDRSNVFEEERKIRPTKQTTSH